MKKSNAKYTSFTPEEIEDKISNSLKLSPKRIDEWLWCLDDELKEWAEENGIKINSSLDLYNFPGTGRGFISKRQILKHQTVLEIPKEILLNVNWIYQNGISCVSQAVKTNPNFRIDAFEMVTLWLMYEKQKGCRSDLRTEFKI